MMKKQTMRFFEDIYIYVGPKNAHQWSFVQEDHSKSSINIDQFARKNKKYCHKLMIIHYA